VELQLNAIGGISRQVEALRSEVSELKAVINSNTQLTSALVEIYNKTLQTLSPKPVQRAPIESAKNYITWMLIPSKEKSSDIYSFYAGYRAHCDSHRHEAEGLFAFLSALKEIYPQTYDEVSQTFRLESI
jgi:hypothetical protein